MKSLRTLSEQFRERSRILASTSWSRIQAPFERARELLESPYVEAAFWADIGGPVETSQVHRTITKVAIANSILAALPGKMGVGALVSIAMEFWMAWTIARHEWRPELRPREAWKHFVGLGATAFAAFYGFRILIGFFYSLFAVVPGVNPLIPAELFTTNLVGVAMIVGFRELARNGHFAFPRRLVLGITQEAYELTRHQLSWLRSVFTRENVAQKRRWLISWFRGDMVSRQRRISDEAMVAFTFAAMTARGEPMVEGQLDQTFIRSVRDALPELEDASVLEIAEHLRNYEGTRLEGLLSHIKGRYFERLVEQKENADGDPWMARLHEDMRHPSTDLEIFNQETGETLAVSLKATDDAGYVGRALARYPNAPIWTTSEVSEAFDRDTRVQGTSISSLELDESATSQVEELRAADAAASPPIGPALLAGGG
jgi:hypothetical protein